MTAFDRFDPFEQRIVDAIDELAAARRPEYLEDVFGVVQHTPQRPRWSFPGRWIPALDTTGAAARTPARPLLLVAVAALLALAAAAILIAGARPKLPLPVGPARNGALVYGSTGDLFRRATPTSPAEVVVHTSSEEKGPYLSPDGRTIAYVHAGAAGDELWAVEVDGGDPRRIYSDPIGKAWSQWSWALDSRHLLVTGAFNGTRKILDIAADGSGAREIAFDGLIPWDAFWSPVDPNRFAFRAQKTTGVGAMDIYLADVDGGNLRGLGLDAQSRFGPQYTLSGLAWSPDGKRIAYNTDELIPEGFATVFRVHVIDVDGTHDVMLPAPPDDPTANQGWPLFSPDGTQILVQRWHFPTAGGASDGSGWIALLPADGSSAGRDIGYRVDDTSDPDVVKGWSPDGRFVIEFVDDGLRTFLVDPVTGDPSPLELGDDIPDWQRLAP